MSGKASRSFSLVGDNRDLVSEFVAKEKLITCVISERARQASEPL